MQSIYTNHTYLDRNPTWHEEDSAWKSEQVVQFLRRHELPLATVAEVGCGAGGILAGLRDALPDNLEFHGFDIAPDAIAMARKREGNRLHFHNQDLFTNAAHYDLLLVMDVVEHVPDYLDFLERCGAKARFKIYHIPLDIHVSSVVRASFLQTRKSVGHLHYFTAESALASLSDTGHEILAFRYTDGGVALARLHPSVWRSTANLARRCVSAFSTHWAARLFGGYSLLVLAK